MNHIYRHIWNHRTQSLVVVAESTRGRGKSGSKAKTVAAAVAGAILALGAGQASAADQAISTPVTAFYDITSGDSLTINSNGSVIDTGNLSGDGNVNLRAGSAAGFIYNNGAIGTLAGPTGATGGIKLGASASASVSVAGSITNSGQIAAINFAIEAFAATIGGSIINTETGNMTVTGGGYAIGIMEGSTIGGSIINQGTLRNDANAGINFVGSTVVGGITNAGTVSASTTAISVEDGRIGTHLVNDGQVISDGWDGIAFGGNSGGSSIAGDIRNNGTITASNNGIAVWGSGNTIGGGVTNSGRIDSGAHGLYLGGVAITTGNVLNTSIGVINAGARGIFVESTSSIAGAIENSGRIAGGDHGVFVSDSTVTGGIINRRGGTITGGSAGIQITSSAVVGRIVNDGTISSGDTGIVIYSSSVVTSGITNSGLIEGTSGAGIYSETSSNIAGGIHNLQGGTITGGTKGITLTAGVTVGGITNAGLIRGVSNIGIEITDGSISGSIINSASGIISGGQTGIYLKSVNMSGKILNHGLIEGGGANYGIHVSSSSLIAQGITNTGTISGGSTGIYNDFGTIAGGLTNSGTISGANYAVLNLGTIDSIAIVGTNAKFLGDVSATSTDVFVKSGAIFGNTNAFDVGSFTVESGALFNFGVGPTTSGGLSTSGVKVANGFSNDGIVAVTAGVSPTITGNYIQNSGGTFRFSLTDATTYGKLNVSGNATLTDGAKVDVVLAGTPGARIDGVLVAGGTLTATPANLVVTDNSLFYDFTASTARAAQELDLITVAAPNPLTNVVTSFNNPAAVGVAGALESMFATGIPAGMQPVFDALGTLTPAQANTALSQLVPAVQGAGSQAGINALHSMNKIIQSRVESNQGLSSGNAPAERYMWARVFGNWGDQDDHKGVSGFKSKTAGFVIGGDAPVNDKVRAGGAFTYARSDIKGNSAAAPSSVDVDTFELVGYGSYNIDPLTDINVQVDLGQNNANSKRLTFGGGSAQADFKSIALHGSIGIGRVMPLSAQTNMTPSVRLDYTHMRTNGYTESGATLPGANLQVDASTYKEFLITGDVKFAHQLSEYNKLVGNVSVGYDFLNKQAQTTSTFVGGGPAFETKGLDVSPWLYRAGIGLIHDDKKGMEYSARYDLETRSSGYLNQTASVKLRWAF